MKGAKRHSHFFLFCFVVLIVQPFLQKMEWFAQWTLLKNLDEFLLLISIPIVYHGFTRIGQKNIKVFKGFFFMYIALGLVYALLNGVPFVAMMVQTLFELKFIIVLFLLLAIGSRINLEIVFERILKLVILLNVSFVIFQFIDSERYDEVFASGGHTGLFILKDSTLIRAAGMFWHQNQLAFFSAVAAGYFLIVRGFSWRNVWVISSVLLLFVTLQRQEIVSFILAYLFARYLFMKESFKGKRALYVMGSFAVLSLFVIVFFPLLELLIQQSGLLDPSQSIDPRIVFYYNSIKVFFDYFPFGSGFGTFGGYAAANYNQVLYDELNFGNYTWFNQNVFLTDTYYPHVIAETGLIGVIFFVLFSTQLYKYIKSNDSEVKYKVMAFFSISLLISVSFTSPNFNDIFCLFLTFTSFSLMINSHKRALYGKDKSIGNHAAVK